MKLLFRRTWFTARKGCHHVYRETRPPPVHITARAVDDIISLQTIQMENAVMADEDRASQIEHENKMIRRLRFLVELTFATIAQDHDLTLDQAWEHVNALKGAAVAMFPGKEDTFDLIYLPRFSRLLAERFRAN